jgi:dihydropteroate synthase
MKGTPKTMQANPSYDNLMIELVQYLEERIAFAFSAGITRKKIILDPGIGFGKRVEDNFVILNELQTLVDLGYPVLVGPSRKSFIGLTLDLPENDRLEGTSATITAAVLNGAKIVRVHDVKEMRRVVLISDAIRLEGAAA